MKIVCTTVIRYVRGRATHGHIYEVDWSRQAIVRKMEIPRPRGDQLLMRLNPRGGARGGRGIRITKDAIYVANDNTIIKYDHDWNELTRISNQLLTGIHEIDLVADGIWAASTSVDLAVKLSFSGRVLKTWSPRTSNGVKRILGIEDKYKQPWPPRIVGWGYYNPYRVLAFLIRKLAEKKGLPNRSRHPWHVLDVAPKTAGERFLWWMYNKFPALSPDNFHLNCVSRYKDEIYITILTWPWREKACVVRIEPDVAVELGTRDIGIPHNGQILDEDRLIINDTGRQAVKIFARRTGTLIKAVSCSDMGVDGKAWLRGLKRVDGDRVLVGIGSWAERAPDPDSPRIPTQTQIVELDLNTGQVLKRVILSEDPNTSPHGLDAIW